MGLHDKYHPLITGYKKTLERSFPLILVIGREPNSNVQFIDKVGLYDFDEAPRCAFWNMAYKLVAELDNMTVRQFKQICRLHNSSPIIFSDALCLPIKSEIRNKTKIRGELSHKDIGQHINNIFAKSILTRVKLILLSGLNRKEFQYSNAKFVRICSENNFQFQEIPFLYPTNYKKIHLTENTKGTIIQIVKTWR